MKKVTQTDFIGPDGFEPGSPNNFVAVGSPDEIAQMLRGNGWSDEAVECFLAGKGIMRNVVGTPFGLSATEIL